MIWSDPPYVQQQTGYTFVTVNATSSRGINYGVATYVGPNKDIGEAVIAMKYALSDWRLRKQFRRQPCTLLKVIDREQIEQYALWAEIHAK